MMLKNIRVPPRPLSLLSRHALSILAAGERRPRQTFELSARPRPASLVVPALRNQSRAPAIQSHVRRGFSSTARRDASQVAKPFVLADIGEGITEVEIVKWLVNPGDTVEAFDPIVEVMSDKASVEITSPFSGTVTELSGAAGDMLRVGNTLCTIHVKGEGDGEDAPVAPEPSAASDHSSEAPAPPPSSSSSSSSSDGRQQPVHDTASSHTKPAAEILATPGTRRFAREHGVDLARLKGTGKHGRVTKEDVYAFVTGAGSAAQRKEPQASPTSFPPTPSAPVSTAFGESKPNDSTTVPLSPTRRAMFRAMTASLAIPHFAYSDTLDVTELERLRRSLSANIPLRYRKVLTAADEATLARQTHWDGDAPQRVEEGKRIDRLTLLPLLLKALSFAVADHPLFLHTLSSPSTDSSEPTLTRRTTHDISVALSSSSPAGGLFTPVLRDVQHSSVFALASQLAGLQAVLGSSNGTAPRFPPEHMGAGTLTLSNVGVVGGRGTHPVIPPTGQLAIGAIGRVRVEPRFAPGQEEARARRVAQGVEEVDAAGAGCYIQPRLVLDATFTADHRVVEGVELARLVETWKRIVEEPARLVGQ